MRQFDCNCTNYQISVPSEHTAPSKNEYILLLSRAIQFRFASNTLTGQVNSFCFARMEDGRHVRHVTFNQDSAS